MRHFSLKQIREGGDQKPEILDEARSLDRGPAADEGITPIGGRDRAIWWIVASGLGLTAAIAFGTAILLSNLQDRARADAKRVLNTTAYVIAEHCEGTFQSVELVQRNVIERMQSLGIASAEDLDRRMAGFDTHSMLKDMVSGVPQLDALVLVDPSGKLVVSSREWPMPDATQADREYFKALAADDNLMLFLNEPSHSRRSGAWTSYLARRLVGPNGEFIGMIVGVMELRHFEQFFGSISIGKEVAIALFRSDGVLLARDPHVEAAIGQNGARTARTALFQDTWSIAVGEDQLASLQALTHYPVVVSVSTTASAALAPWLKEAKIIIGAVGLAALSIGVFILAIVRRLMQGIRRSRQRLRGQKLQLDTRVVDVRFAGSRGSLQQALHGDLWGARRHGGARL